MFDKRAPARHFGFGRADLSSPTLVDHALSNLTPTLSQKPGTCLLICPHSGSHGSSQWVSCSRSSGSFRTTGRTDWSSPSGCSWHRCALVPSIPFPPGGTQHAPVRTPGPNQSAEDSRQSQQPSSGQSGETAVQQRERHQEGDAGGRLKLRWLLKPQY